MTAKPTRRTGIKLRSIRRDGGTQIRAALDEATVTAYAEAYKAGTFLPPLVVFHDGESFWLADGFHRAEGAMRAQVGSLPVDLHQGTKRDAILYACGANAEHGLPRSNADKRRAVETLLADPEWREWTLRKLAAAAGVSHNFVAEIKASLSSDDKRVTRVTGHRLALSSDDKKDSAPPEAGSTGGDQRGPGSSRPSEERPGEEGAGTCGRDDGASDSHEAAPAPNEPPIDMLGQSAPVDWLETVATTVRIVDRLDQELRQLQAAARALPQPHGQRLHASLHEAAAVARAVRPEVVCPPAVHRAKDCLACAGLGWLSAEGKKGLHPSALQSAKPNGKRLHIQDENGNPLT